MSPVRRILEYNVVHRHHSSGSLSSSELDVMKSQCRRMVDVSNAVTPEEQPSQPHTADIKFWLRINSYLVWFDNISYRISVNCVRVFLFCIDS